jgi:hypothetical protein
VTPRSDLLRRQAIIPLSHTRWLRIARRAPILIAALVLAGALGRGAVQAGSHLATALSTQRIAAEGPTYGVGDLQRQVAGDPGRWIGRTVLVRGRVAMDRTWSAPDSIGTRFELLDPGTPGGTPSLLLDWGGADQLLVSLRRLPLIGRLVPQPQVLRWDARATYRVRLRASPARECGTPPCYEALLLDASPGDW